ncbi:MAG TPA: dockerin type I domain-containing protein [Thermoanaerobaculaceae bacterium]|nr:dockerin type I domain-containing protein [Thermoanaerobaculaceae bacterium]
MDRSPVKSLGSRGRLIPVLIAVVASVSVAGFSAAQPYTIPWYTIDGGGVMGSTGGVYTLSGTIGQPDAGPTLTGGSYSLIGGFWGAFASASTGGLRGDANNDSAINVSDVFYLINTLFAGGPAPASLCLGDATNDGAQNVSDVFYLINFLFAGGAAPTPPTC